MKALARIAAFALVGLAGCTIASAQNYPSKPVTIIVPFAPGGTTDILARLAAEILQKEFKQSFVTENRTGAGGVIGNTAVARAAPDGYTLLFTPTAFGITPYTTKNVSYDPVKDFKPVSLVGYTANVMVVNPKVPAKTVKEFADYAKSKGEVVYASPGVGTPTHMGVEVFALRSGFKVRHVPYRGVAPALNDLVTGEIGMMFMDLAPAIPLIEAGKVRAIASLTKDRHPLLPNLPTVNESMPGFYLMGWQGLLAPGGTPDEIVDKLNAPLVAYLKTKEAAERLRKIGVDVAWTTPQEMRDWIGSQLAWWGKVAKDAGITPK